MKVKEVDNAVWGEGTVLDEFPSKDTDLDPHNMPEIELTVSTGNPPA
jgi:eukaryotic-like serine/threonine-protein kinase